MSEKPQLAVGQYWTSPDGDLVRITRWAPACGRGGAVSYVLVMLSHSSDHDPEAIVGLYEQRHVSQGTWFRETHTPVLDGEVLS